MDQPGQRSADGRQHFDRSLLQEGDANNTSKLAVAAATANNNLFHSFQLFTKDMVFNLQNE